ncbi:MAG: hypothetical protein CL454_00795 [Acidimicrobiaceae bacterium]|nr:hypothetical protein [Acidimicrobiaceae bacterium]
MEPLVSSRFDVHGFPVAVDGRDLHGGEHVLLAVLDTPAVAVLAFWPPTDVANAFPVEKYGDGSPHKLPTPHKVVVDQKRFASRPLAKPRHGHGQKKRLRLDALGEDKKLVLVHGRQPAVTDCSGREAVVDVGDGGHGEPGSNGHEDVERGISKREKAVDDVLGRFVLTLELGGPTTKVNVGGKLPIILGQVPDFVPQLVVVALQGCFQSCHPPVHLVWSAELHFVLVGALDAKKLTQR